MLSDETITANLHHVQARIAGACARAGRSASDVLLVAVTKMRSVDEIRAAYRCGARHFGENRVEEAAEKVPLLCDEMAEDPPTWHLIGHVQSRKARQAVELSDVVHSVDSLRLGVRLARFAAERERRLPVLVELNVSGESSKYGLAAASDGDLSATLPILTQLAEMPSLDVRGLMTVAPIVSEPGLVRPVFSRLRGIRDRLRVEHGYDWPELSMGMTDDYEVAIEEGATMVRIGRAIFGPR